MSNERVTKVPPKIVFSKPLTPASIFPDRKTLYLKTTKETFTIESSKTKQVTWNDRYDAQNSQSTTIRTTTVIANTATDPSAPQGSKQITPEDLRVAFKLNAERARTILMIAAQSKLTPKPAPVATQPSPQPALPGYDVVCRFTFPLPPCSEIIAVAESAQRARSLEAKRGRSEQTPSAHPTPMLDSFEKRFCGSDRSGFGRG